MKLLGTTLAALGLALLSAVSATDIATPAHTFSTFFTSVTPTPAKVLDDVEPSYHTGRSGALAPTPAPPDAGFRGMVPGPAVFTYAITNLAGVELTTLHGKNKNADGTVFPTPIGGIPPAGNFAAGSTFSLLVPTGWAGRVAFNKAGNPIVGDESLIEGSYRHQEIVDYALGDIDVSYVDGYTFPIICKCRSTGKVLTGCIDPKLWGQSKTCPEIGLGGACRNPHRDKTEITYAHEWFAACAGRAYTFPDDDLANSNGECQSGTVDCEIHPK